MTEFEKLSAVFGATIAWGRGVTRKIDRELTHQHTLFLYKDSPMLVSPIIGQREIAMASSVRQRLSHES